MKNKELCALFNEPNTRDGFQRAYWKLGERILGRNWRDGKKPILFGGFNVKKNLVLFWLIEITMPGSAQTIPYRLTIGDAIDCISGNVANLTPTN